MNSSRWRSAALIGALLLTMAGCSSQPQLSAVSKTPVNQLIDEVLSGEAVLGRHVGHDDLPSAEILKVDQTMREFVDRYVSGFRTDRARTHHLLTALLSPGTLGLRYQDDATRTAKDAFHSLQANCLAFSNLYIALAREAGLKAYYQDVLVAPEWELEEGAMTLRRHVNVLVKQGRGYSQIIDISRTRGNIVRLKATRLSDEEAFAQFYNNRSIDYLHAQDNETAFLYALKALHLDSKSAFIWSNLGVIVSRFELPEHAEAVLLKAASLDEGEQAALSNLSTLYGSLGEQEKADYYASRVDYYRSRNPYYLLITARQAYEQQSYEETLRLLRKALALKSDEALLFELKSRAHLQLGQSDQAIMAMRKAIAAAETVSQNREYTERLGSMQRAAIEKRKRQAN